MSTLRDDGMSWNDPPGPWRADQIKEGERVELSNGHAIQCTPAGRRHGGAHAAGAIALATAAREARKIGVDVGVAWNDGKNLRSPDLVVGLDMLQPGWAREAPPLAVEYADVGQDEAELRKKILELIAFGTRHIWVVRLTGPLRVDVHEPGLPTRTVDADGQLTAPGVLDHPVPVRALVDTSIAVETALDTVRAEGLQQGLQQGLQKGRAEGLQTGHAAGLVEGRAEGRAEGRVEGRAEGRANGRIEGQQDAVLALCAARGWTLPTPLAERVRACSDAATLLRWLTQAAVASNSEAALR